MIRPLSKRGRENLPSPPANKPAQQAYAIKSLITLDISLIEL